MADTRGLASPEVNTDPALDDDERSGGTDTTGSSLLWRGRRPMAGAAPLFVLAPAAALVLAGLVLAVIVLVTR